jgi:uncharacterized protein YecE (DUF72 family)
VTAVRKRPVARAAAYRVGTAGWALPRDHRSRFPEDGTNLQRYAGLLPAAEINSSFYRPHKPAIYERWAASVPAGFRFAVKIPKAITHVARLVDAGPALDEFLAQATALGDRLGCLLVQLPPSLAFDATVAMRFLGALRERHAGGVALEARHASWFEAEAERVMVTHAVARVAADPAKVPEASEPGGHGGLVYVRLHGTPRMYYSSYEDAYLDALATRLRAAVKAGSDAWCIFDNTAHGHATGNALALLDRLAARPPRHNRDA